MLAWVDESENIKVYLRIRPFVEREDAAVMEPGFHRKSCSVVTILDEHATTVSINNPRAMALNAANGLAMTGEQFTFDAVGGPDVPQEAVFEAVARPITENCLQGYNGTIFA